jgi:hypothetical protein
MCHVTQSLTRCFVLNELAIRVATDEAGLVDDKVLVAKLVEPVVDHALEIPRRRGVVDGVATRSFHSVWPCVPSTEPTRWGECHLHVRACVRAGGMW